MNKINKMKKELLFLTVILFLLVIPSIVSSANVDSQVFEKLNENQEVSVIVMLKDSPSTLKGLSAINKADKNQILEQKKAMIKEQQGKVLLGLNLKDKSKNLIKLNNAKSHVSTTSSDTDFNLRHKYSTVNGFSGMVTNSGLEKLMNDPDVEKVYLNREVHITLDQSIPQINADDVWKLKLNNINITGKDETICIIDTGIDTDHSAFTGRILNQYCYCSITNYGSGGCCPNNKTEDVDAEDDDGHGTHCAGIAAGNYFPYVGVAPEAGIISIKGCNSTGTCSEDDIIAGINWCVDNATLYNISVISMSLGGGGPYNDYCNGDVLASAINSAVEQNISVIVASGNDGWTNGISSPACVQNAIPVGSVDDGSGGTNTDDISSFTNRGNILNILAPGVSITAPYLGGGTVTMDGTSMATPHVAGAAALLKQFIRLYNGSDITPKEIEDVLNDTGKEIDDMANSGRNYSRVDVYSAILSLDTTVPQYLDVGKNDTSIKVNDVVLFYANWSDSVGLSHYIFSWNHSGSWENESAVELTDWSNVTMEVNATGNPEINWKIYANDSANNWNDTGTQTFTVGNTAPTITNNVTSPATVYTNTNWKLNITIIDSNDDILTGYVQFYINDTVNSSVQSQIVSSGTNTLVATLNNGNFSKDYNLTAEFWAGDGTANTTKENTTHIIVQNSAPTQPNLTNPANNSYTNTTPITMNWTISTDADNDTVYYYVLINGAQECNTTDINCSYIPSSEAYYEWKITAFDRTENGTSSNSRFYTYDITKPIITNITHSSITSSSATLTVTTDESATCAYTNANDSVEYASMTAFSTTGGTSHSKSLSGLSALTGYTYYVRCNDTTGNVMNFSNSTTFTTSAALTSSGGGGGTPTVTYEQESLGTLAAGSGKAVTFSKSKTLAVTEITVTVKNEVTNAKIKVDTGSLPSGASKPSTKGSVYKYIEITKTGMTDSDVSKGVIKFKVKKSWLTDKGYGKDTIVLHRYYNNKWAKLTTTRDSQDITYYYYSAESPGFSTFAITAEEAPVVIVPPAEKDPEEEEPEEAEATEEVLAEEEAPAQVEAPEEEKEASSNTTLIVTLIAVIIVFITVIYFVQEEKQKKKRDIIKKKKKKHKRKR